VLAVATRLGLTSFGGPVAHIGYFREEYVARRRWIDEPSFAELVALCQFLPGPASSQLGMAIGLLRAGKLGALAAWVGFTLPSAAALVAFAYGVREYVAADAGWLHGLELVAVAVVAYAVVGMARTLTPDVGRAALALAAAATSLAVGGVLGQIGPIAAGGVVGVLLLRRGDEPGRGPRIAVGRRLGVAALALFLSLLVALPLLRETVGGQALALVDSFYRAGSLVFGGGHVVLPLLHAEVVPPGWVGNEEFVAGYGAAQAVPGPLFTFAAYLGAVMGPAPSGLLGAALALGAIFLPSVLLVAGVLPFWHAVRPRPRFRAALRGVSAAVVGLLLAALWDPVVVSAIGSLADVGVALVLFALLALVRLPSWLVVGIGALAGAGLGALQGP
jgi:chromate transporter